MDQHYRGRAQVTREQGSPPFKPRPWRGVLLDRDGVLCRAPTHHPPYVTCWDQFVWLPGAVEAVRALVRENYAVAIVTNQSAVGRGLMSGPDLAEIHRRMAVDLGDQAAGVRTFACTHHPDDLCECRKPMPGLLTRAMAELHVKPGETVMVGDHATDLEAGRRAGCGSAFLTCGRGDRPSSPPARFVGSFASLSDFVSKAIGIPV